MSDLVDRKILENFVRSELGSEREIFDSLFGIFKSQFEGGVTLPTDVGPSKQMSTLAHKLEPGCKSFGAIALVAKLKQIEICVPGTRQAKLLIFEVEEIAKPTIIQIRDIADQVLGRRGAA